jgi:hypothetical protein
MDHVGQRFRPAGLPSRPVAEPGQRAAPPVPSRPDSIMRIA